MIKTIVLLLLIISPFLSMAAEMPIPFEIDGKWGYSDKQGREIISPQFIIAEDFSTEGIATVVDGQGWLYINIQGHKLIRPFVFDNGPDPFKGGLARFYAAKKIGYFDTKGQIVIEPKFTFGMPFSEGLAAVCSGCTKVFDGEHWSMAGGKWGYINKQGKLVLPFEYDSAEKFMNGSAQATLKGMHLTLERVDIGGSTGSTGQLGFVSITKKFDYDTLVEYLVETLDRSDAFSLTFSQRLKSETSGKTDYSTLVYRNNKEVGKTPLSARRFNLKMAGMLKAIQNRFGSDLNLQVFRAQKFLGVKEIEMQNVLAFKDFPVWHDYLNDKKKYSEQEIYRAVLKRWQEKEVFAEIINTFNDLGYTLSLSNFEKLFILKAGASPLFPELEKMGINKNDNFPYPGLVSFSLSQ